MGFYQVFLTGTSVESKRNIFVREGLAVIFWCLKKDFGIRDIPGVTKAHWFNTSQFVSVATCWLQIQHNKFIYKYHHKRRHILRCNVITVCLIGKHVESKINPFLKRRFGSESLVIQEIFCNRIIPKYTKDHCFNPLKYFPNQSTLVISLIIYIGLSSSNITTYF